jgi:hypothetical protein
MPDRDETQLARLARRLLTMPPKKRKDSKIGKRKAKEKVVPKRKPSVSAKL